MIFQMIFFWECSARNFATQGQIVCKSKEGLAFADRDFCDEFKNCGANATPLLIAPSQSPDAASQPQYQCPQV
jgi:hypothetical protein